MKINHCSRNLKGVYLIAFLITGFLLLSFSKNSTDFGNATVQDDGTFVVVLDAGHGGHDPGNLGNGYLEKDIALKIVLKVGEILGKNPKIKVIYTRDDDTFIDLYVRGEIANKANADLFVSVHCDSHTSNANGAGTFVLGLHANKQNFAIAKKENSVIYLEDNYESRYAEYDINSPESVIGLTIMQEEFLDQSIMLAKFMQDNFANKLKRNDRKVKQAGFIVLHQTFMPSVLVETGFLTNKNEGAYLNSKSGQGEMGKAIAEAILEYRKNIALGVEGISSISDEIVTAPTPVKSNPVKEETPSVEAPPPAKEIVEEEVVAPKEQIEKELEAVLPKETEELPTKTKESLPAVVENKKPVVEEKIVKNKEAVIKNADVESKTSTAAKPNEEKSNIVFKVQLLASSKDLALRPEDFRGLNTLSKEPYKNLFRYMYGNTNSYQQAKLLKSNADVKGYTTSYIVAYRDGVRIPITEAIK